MNGTSSKASAFVLIALIFQNIRGGNNRSTFPMQSFGTPTISRKSTTGFTWDSADNNRRRGNDSTRYRKEASEEPNISNPPRLASIYKTT